MVLELIVYAVSILDVYATGELYGEFNLLTSEWTDGLVPKMVRQCVQAGTEGSDNRKWIIFDGPVDAVWIENMNTVRASPSLCGARYFGGMQFLGPNIGLCVL